MPGREETPLDQGVFDSTLAAELAKGTDRRVAEGRARSAAVRAYRKEHGEPEREARPAAAAPSGDGGGNGGAQPAAAPVAAAVAYAPAPAAAVRTAPPPTGRAPTPKP
ncbi:MAG: hypothetical protein E6G47_09025, partial [Actinobacteria bacterium]